MASEIGEEQYGSVPKRSRLAAQQQLSQSNDVFSIPPNWQYNNPVDEPRPLGLSLRKTPSLLNLIQTMWLSQSQGSSSNSSSADDSPSKKKDDDNNTNEKLMKASSFPVLVLRIGSWECVSRRQGDVVAKCYYGKRQLVWEVLDGSGVKSKMEIQWSDITALRADCPRGTLTLTLARTPAFFRETDPQPRKNTAWRPTTDFTGGQATLHKQHHIQCTPGALDKHYQNLIHCDTRLAILSRQPAADQILVEGCEQMTSLPDILGNMAQVLLSDTTDDPTDEMLLMKKVDSLCCCLLQEEDGPGQNVYFDLANDYKHRGAGTYHDAKTRLVWRFASQSSPYCFSSRVLI